MTIWSFRSSRWKPRHQSGCPSKTANGLCPSLYRTHICTSPWQGLYRNTCGSWSMVKCTSSAGPPHLRNLPRQPCGIKGSSSMFTWTTGLSAPHPRTGQNSCQFDPASIAAPRLGDQFQQVWFVTQPAVQFHRHAIQYEHLHCDTSAQNWVKIQNTLEFAPSRHRQGSPQNFGHFDLYVHPSAKRSALPPRPIQWWASEAWCQVTGSWSDRISVTLTILHETAWWSSPAVLQGFSLSALEAEITLFTDASSHRWGHSISCIGRCPGSRQTSTSICRRWRV